MRDGPQQHLRVEALTRGRVDVHAAEGACACSARLGVVRLDFDYPPAPGDVDHPGSYGYDVYYRVVPGLTFAMCQSGKMPPEIEERFTNAVKWLDAKGVSISIPRASNWLAD